MSTDNREDYLINILRLTEGTGVVKTTELANYMKVSPASVTEMLKVLQKEGLVNYERYRGVSLTEEGNIRARDLRRKHHIMERFLTDVLQGFLQVPQSPSTLVPVIRHILLAASSEMECSTAQAWSWAS